MSQFNNSPAAESKKETLIFACSGAADVGEIADRAARQLMWNCYGKMFCLAGVGGEVPDILGRAKAAGKILLIDGCEKDCALHCAKKAGLQNLIHLRLSDMGMEKGKTPATTENVQKVATRGASLIGA